MVGVDDVEAEYQEIQHACDVAKQVKHPFIRLLTRSSVPPLTIAVLLQVFQQFTGINAIMFYAPVLFQTMGFESSASLLSTVITGTVNVLSTFVAVFGVDKFGRRKLLLQACVQMFIAQKQQRDPFGGTKDDRISKQKSGGGRGVSSVHVRDVLRVVVGAVGLADPSETFPLETRTAGFAFAVSSNMLFTFLIAQAFLSMLCHMRASIFFFFSAWILIMGIFVYFLLPETKGVPIDSITERVWKQHPV
ncbi:unnamed protein product [Thlaspi arvense]|uniref:Major facilitator superfamily (MFS) profile domain-containing protein n=1 Tax=Thlaspi arvense TaxID=13288 RepID=A0AAU9S2G1_THLAR|nr:unnamed protein product [Thlaspi arvense]